MTQLSKKAKDLQKKMARLEKESENAKKKLAEQQEVVDKKQQELGRVNTEFVSQLLVDNDLNMKHLPGILSSYKYGNTQESTEKKGVSSHSMTSNDNTTGGNSSSSTY